MRYRTADVGDHDGVVDLWMVLAEEMLAYGSRIDPPGSRPAVASHLGERLADDRVIVADDEGSLVGLVVHARRDDPLVRTASVGVIEFLYVAPTHRGRGIGSALLERAESVLAPEVDVVELEVLEANEDAIAFYEAHDYRPDRRTVVKALEPDPESP
ncbi:MAG: N-acetyltransferase family protein [Halobacteriales archaeon]